MASLFRIYDLRDRLWADFSTAPEPEEKARAAAEQWNAHEGWPRYEVRPADAPERPLRKSSEMRQVSPARLAQLAWRAGWVAARMGKENECPLKYSAFAEFFSEGWTYYGVVTLDRWDTSRGEQPPLDDVRAEWSAWTETDAAKALSERYRLDRAWTSWVG